MIIITFVQFFFLFKNLPAYYNNTLVSFFFFYKTWRHFFLQNLPVWTQILLACSLFILVRFFFFKLTSMNSANAGTGICTVYADKFLNKKKLNKSSNDYMRPIMQAFLSFFSLFLIRRICVYCLCISLSVLI